MAAVAVILDIGTYRVSNCESLQYLPPSFCLTRLTVREQMLFEDFHDATIAATLNIGMERF